MNEEKTIPPAQYDETEEWVKEYIEQFGEEPSFFKSNLVVTTAAATTAAKVTMCE